MWGKAPAQTSGLIGRKWKHREVLELTGTNRPRTCPHTTPRGWHPANQRQTSVIASTVRYLNQQPSGPRTGGVTIGSQRYGGHGERETPGSIPNPEAKPLSADGTALGTGWESRTPPDNHYRRGPSIRAGAPFGMSLQRILGIER